MNRRQAAVLALIFGCIQGLAHGASGEVAKAEKERKKPLQRCDQLSGEAELECLKKARERIVEARKKRETAATKGEESKLAQKRDEKDAPKKK